MGTFDGQGYTVTGINFTNDNCPVNEKEEAVEIGSSDYSAAGFFNCLFEGATVKNLTISGANIKSSHYAGGIAGYVYYGAKIENCHVVNSNITSYVKEYKDKTASKSEYNNGDKVGGIAGFVGGATIDGCTVKGTTIKGYRDLGGIVGYLDGKTSTVTNCEVKDGVKVIVDNTNGYKSDYTENSKFDAGSIVGENQVGASAIVNCTGEAEITLPFATTPSAPAAGEGGEGGTTSEGNE